MISQIYPVPSLISGPTSAYFRLLCNKAMTKMSVIGVSSSNDNFDCESFAYSLCSLNPWIDELKLRKKIFEVPDSAKLSFSFDDNIAYLDGDDNPALDYLNVPSVSLLSKATLSNNEHPLMKDEVCRTVNLGYVNDDFKINGISVCPEQSNEPYFFRDINNTPLPVIMNRLYRLHYRVKSENGVLTIKDFPFFLPSKTDLSELDTPNSEDLFGDIVDFNDDLNLTLCKYDRKIEDMFTAKEDVAELRKYLTYINNRYELPIAEVPTDTIDLTFYLADLPVSINSDASLEILHHFIGDVSKSTERVVPISATSHRSECFSIVSKSQAADTITFYLDIPDKLGYKVCNLFSLFDRICGKNN